MRSGEPISWRGPGLALAAWLCAGAYLGGPALFVAFVLMVGGLLFPAASLLANGLRGSGLGDELRLCAGGAGAILLAIPVFYLRRALPLPGWAFDVVAMLALSAAAIRTGIIDHA